MEQNGFEERTAQAGPETDGLAEQAGPADDGCTEQPHFLPEGFPELPDPADGDPRKKKLRKLRAAAWLVGLFLPGVGWLADVLYTPLFYRLKPPGQPGHWAPVFTFFAVVADVLFIIIMCIVISCAKQRIREEDL